MSGDLTILLYNKVELEDGSQGIVRYMGNIMGKKGVFYGIDITKGNAKNDGTFKKIKYFDTKKGTKTGRFCKLDKITKCKKTTFSKYPFQMDEVVMCTKTKCKGRVKYIGVPSWVKGGKVYYGLQLAKKKGTCNGTMSGVQYFESKTNYGIYVPAKQVTKVKQKKKKDDDEKEEKDVREHIKGYYRSKSGKNLLPESIKTKGKKEKKKKPKKVNKQPPSEPRYLSTKKRTGSLEANPPTPQPPMPQKPRPSVDYMDEEKDGIDLSQYTAKTEQMDYENQERQRRDQIDRLKQMEREDKLKREEEKKQKLKEQEERQRRKQDLADKKNEERAKELSRKERQLKDKERLEKYRQAIEDRENAEKQQQKDKEQLAETQSRNEKLKQQEREQKRAKEEAERQEMEEQRQLAAKLRKEKEAKIKAQQQEAERLRKEKAVKMKAEEEEKSQSIVANGSGGGSIKDRMAMFQKQTNRAPTTKPTAPVKYGTNKNAEKKPTAPVTFTPKSNTSGVGAPVGADKAINFEMTEAFGKPLNKIKTTKVAGYTGEIPLVLYLLGEKLVRMDRFGTFKIFHPEMMEKEKDKPEMQIAHNIFTFFADLPSPLLSTVPQSVLDKAINKDVMKDVVAVIGEPYASTLVYLWDILAKVAMNPNARMGQQSLGKVFGPMCTMLTQQDVKGNRVSMNALAASRMMAFFRRGVEWRMETQGFNFEDSDDDSD